MGDALDDMALFREFLGLDAGDHAPPGLSAILRLRHLLAHRNLSFQILATKNVKPRSTTR